MLQNSHTIFPTEQEQIMANLMLHFQGPVVWNAKGDDIKFSSTVKSHFKALSLYNFKGVLGGLINGGGGGAISGWTYKRNKKNVSGTTR